MNWDVSYWAQKQQQALFNLTDEELRPFLPLPSVLDGLFAVSSPLLVAASGIDIAYIEP